LLRGRQPGGGGLLPGIGGQPPGDERRRQIDEQAQQVARRGDVEGVVGFDEEEVDGEKPGHGGQHRRPRAQPHGGDQGHQHVDQ